MTSNRVRALTLVLAGMTMSVALNMLAWQGRDAKPELSSAGAVLEPKGSRRQHSDTTAAAAAPTSDTRSAAQVAVAKAVQRELRQQGYAPGSVDGTADTETEAAILAFEYDHGLPLTAEPSDALLQMLIMGLPKVSVGTPKRASATAERVIKTVQTTLNAIGYGVGRVDGELGPRTRAAIKSFEQDNLLPETGRISAPLIKAIASSRISRKISEARQSAQR